MSPSSLRTLLSLAGMTLDFIGAILISIQAFRTFKGTKFIKGQTYDDITKPPVESDEFKAWEQSNFRISMSGLGFLFVGLVLQGLSYCVR